MGYYTDFSLTTTPLSDEELSIILEEFAELGVFYDARVQADQSIDAGDSYKWYDWDKDMAALSVEVPDVLFTMHGVGDGSEDMWNAYIQNGAIQYCPARIVYDDYNPKKMKQIIPPRMSDFKAEVADLL